MNLKYVCLLLSISCLLELSAMEKSIEKVEQLGHIQSISLEKRALALIFQVTKKPILLKDAAIQKALMAAPPKILKTFLTEQQSFIPVFTQNATSSQFLAVLAQNEVLFTHSEIQKKFFSLKLSKIYNFLSDPQNSNLIPIFVEHAPVNVFLRVYSKLNINICQNKFIQDRLSKLVLEDTNAFFEQIHLSMS